MMLCNIMNERGKEAKSVAIINMFEAYQSYIKDL